MCHYEFGYFFLCVFLSPDLSSLCGLARVSVSACIVRMLPPLNPKLNPKPYNPNPPPESSKQVRVWSRGDRGLGVQDERNQVVFLFLILLYTYTSCYCDEGCNY